MFEATFDGNHEIYINHLFSLLHSIFLLSKVYMGQDHVTNFHTPLYTKVYEII